MKADKNSAVDCYWCTSGKQAGADKNILAAKK